ncbi:MAG: putative aldo-keto reductase [Actinotalea sp.]|nr:putative aldo-keto reductase [Actinotalea sp.]
MVDVTGTLAGRPVPRLGLGCMTMTQAGRDEDECALSLRAAFDGGVRMFDTADRYGHGRNEELLARALGHVRDETFLATKVGFVGKSSDPHPADGSPAHVIAACEASLRRLQTDRVDLLYLHRLDRRVPVEDTVGAMAELVTAGKVRALGLSEVAVPTLRRAHAVHPVAAVQSEYSLWSRDPESEMLAACRELGTSFVAYSPLGGGFLTARYRTPEDLPQGSMLAGTLRMAPENLAQNVRLVEQLQALSDALGCTPAQLALAWVLSKGVFAIPSGARLAHLTENLGARTLELDHPTTAELESVFAPGRIAGPRKSATGMAMVDL